MKYYLHPRIIRRGSPVILFIKSNKGGRYELGAYHKIRPKKKKPYLGKGREYDAVYAMTISKHTFMVLKKEARFNEQKFKIKKETKS